MKRIIQLLIIVFTFLLPFSVFTQPTEELQTFIGFSGFILDKTQPFADVPFHGYCDMAIGIYTTTDLHEPPTGFEMHYHVHVTCGEFSINVGEGTPVTGADDPYAFGEDPLHDNDSPVPIPQELDMNIFAQNPDTQYYLGIAILPYEEPDGTPPPNSRGPYYDPAPPSSTDTPWYRYDPDYSYYTFDTRKRITYVPYAINAENAVSCVCSSTTDGRDKNTDILAANSAFRELQPANADYAEWFEKEEDTAPGDIIGINLSTGKARKYCPGDKFIGIHSTMPAIVGNRFRTTDTEMEKTHVLVGLLGQLDFDPDQVIIAGRIVMTTDRKEIGVLLNNGRVLIGR